MHTPTHPPLLSPHSPFQLIFLLQFPEGEAQAFLLLLLEEEVAVLVLLKVVMGSLPLPSLLVELEMGGSEDIIILGEIGARD